MSKFDIQKPIVELPDQDPEPEFSDDELVWTEEEQEQIEAWKDQYAEDQGAIMKVLWLAQEKYGYLPPGKLSPLCPQGVALGSPSRFSGTQETHPKIEPRHEPK